MLLRHFKKSDIVFLHDGRHRAEQCLDCHTAVVVQESRPSDDDSLGLTTCTYSMITDIRGGAGFAKRPLDQVTDGSVFRIRQEGAGVRVALMAMLWITGCVCEYEDDSVFVAGVYDPPSVLTALLGHSQFGGKAKAHAQYLYNDCNETPPDVLKKEGFKVFTGVTCTYLPIALYQAYFGPDFSREYMALDAKRTLPKTLTRYLSHNANWSYLDMLNGF